MKNYRSKTFGYVCVVVSCALIASAMPAFAGEPSRFADCVRVPHPVEHGVNTRSVTMVSSIAVAPGGRIWATWYAGVSPAEDHNNYAVLATSADGGETWREILVADPDGRGSYRAFDPEIWISPDGRLLWFWTNRYRENSKTDDLMMADLGDPDKIPSVAPKARRIARGVMMCKPIVLKDGTWALPVAHWRTSPSSCLYASTDGGRTFELRGGATMPEKERDCDEHMFVERKNGDIVCYTRVKSGIMEAVSKDGGRTWSPSVKSKIAHTCSRFFVSRLNSGAWLLVKHGKVDEITNKRSHLTAYVSDDEGHTWKGGLMLEERFVCSYPDAQQTEDGRIFLTYDYERYTERLIYWCAFTEEDVRAGRDVSGKVKLRKVMSQGSGRALVAPVHVRAPVKMHRPELRLWNGDPVALKTPGGRHWKAWCVRHGPTRRKQYAVLATSMTETGPWKEVLTVDPDWVWHRYPDNLRLEVKGSRLIFTWDDLIQHRTDYPQTWCIEMEAESEPEEFPDARLVPSR